MGVIAAAPVELAASMPLGEYRGGWVEARPRSSRRHTVTGVKMNGESKRDP